MATVGFCVLATGLVAVALVGAFLLVAEPTAQVYAAVCRWREDRQAKENAA